MKELRNQVVVYFKNINRKYADHHLGNTLLHMVCQEGYYTMLQFMFNPANRSDLDTNDLELEPRNNRNRTPLMLCFTPPSATVRFLFLVDELTTLQIPTTMYAIIPICCSSAEHDLVWGQTEMLCQKSPTRWSSWWIGSSLAVRATARTA